MLLTYAKIGPRLVNSVLAMLCIALCTSCAKNAEDFVAEPVTTFTIKSSKTTNDGAPFYVILKFTDFPHFLIDDYGSIANLSVCEAPDSTSFMPICLIPGKTEKRVAIPPANMSTGIYCLFTDCGEEWKYLVDPKEGCGDVTVVLGNHEIYSVDVQ